MEIQCFVNFEFFGVFVITFSSIRLLARVYSVSSFRFRIYEVITCQLSILFLLLFIITLLIFIGIIKVKCEKIHNNNTLSYIYIYIIPIGLPQDTETPVGPYPIIERRGEQIVPVVQAYAFTKYLGKLVLTFNSENRLINAVGGPIFLDQTISQGKEVINA